MLKIDTEDLRKTYEGKLPDHETLTGNLSEALASFLDEEKIPYLDVKSRVKSFSSFEEKVLNKQYNDPFSDCEDICGVRIICYYPDDIDRIDKIINNELTVHEQVNKLDLLKIQEFGYRSTHYIISIPTEWEAAPNYRNLSSYRAEIQVRTVLMHAWAEVEHKLAYKSSDQVPDEFKRRLGWLSAKFEEADDQFQNLRKDIGIYRNRLKSEAEKEGMFSTDSELNLDLLQAMMDYYMPDRIKLNGSVVSDLLDEIKLLDIDTKTLVHMMERYTDSVPRLEAIISKSFSNVTKFAQVGAVRGILDIGHTGYLKGRHTGALKKSLADEAAKIRKETKPA